MLEEIKIKNDMHSNTNKIKFFNLSLSNKEYKDLRTTRLREEEGMFMLEEDNDDDYYRNWDMIF